MSSTADQSDLSPALSMWAGGSGFLGGTSRSALLRATAVLMAFGVILFGAGSSASGATNSVARAESALVRATADRIAAEARLGKAQSKLAAIEAKVARLGEANEKLTLELAQARESMREFAIAAYIDGGQSDIFRATLNPEKAQALAWQSNLSAGQATSADEVAHEYEELKAQNTPARLRAAEELERATQALADSKNDAIQAAAFERDAESALATAREAARVKAAEAASRAAEARSRADAERRASSSGSSSAVSASVSTNRAGSVAPSPPQPDQAADFESSARGNPSESESATLARIRRCESGGNYSIVSSSGRYRGAYQFDYRTWAGVGGSGDPAAASPAEQDYRALLLLRQRGTRPWPVCGR